MWSKFGMTNYSFFSFVALLPLLLLLLLLVIVAFCLYLYVKRIKEKITLMHDGERECLFMWVRGVCGYRKCFLDILSLMRKWSKVMSAANTKRIVSAHIFLFQYTPCGGRRGSVAKPMRNKSESEKRMLSTLQFSLRSSAGNKNKLTTSLHIDLEHGARHLAAQALSNAQRTRPRETWEAFLHSTPVPRWWVGHTRCHARLWCAVNSVLEGSGAGF